MLGRLILVLLFVVSGVNSVKALFIEVQLSTGVPSSIGDSFIAQTTTQFNAVAIKNPLVSNTYSIKIYGLNPNYNPPITNQQLLDALVTVDSYTYVYGWANGMDYGIHTARDIAGGYAINCSTPTEFNLNETSSSTFDTKTCYDVMGSVLDAFYQIDLSTPPVIGGF